MQTFIIGQIIVKQDILIAWGLSCKGQYFLLYQFILCFIG
jgi:hypothetical protein